MVKQLLRRKLTSIREQANEIIANGDLSVEVEDTFITLSTLAQEGLNALDNLPMVWRFGVYDAFADSTTWIGACTDEQNAMRIVDALDARFKDSAYCYATSECVAQ